MKASVEGSQVMWISTPTKGPVETVGSHRSGSQAEVRSRRAECANPAAENSNPQSEKRTNFHRPNSEVLPKLSHERPDADPAASNKRNALRIAVVIEE